MFKGRASRKEYWICFLIHIYFVIITSIFIPIWIIYLIVTLIPTLALGFRRMHDIGKSGWLLLLQIIFPPLGLYFLFLFMQAGDSNDNEYGPPPN